MIDETWPWAKLPPSDPRPNEIECIVEHQLTNIEQQISLLRKSLVISRKQPNGRAWLQMIADFRELQAIHAKLEVINVNVRCAVERIDPLQGVDG